MLVYTAGSKNRLEGVDKGGADTQEQVDPKKKNCCVAEKYDEDVRQDEKHVPDLLELIMKGSGLVKEELRSFSFKIDQFGSNISKIRVSTFWIPEICCFPAGGQCQPSRQ